MNLFAFEPLVPVFDINYRMRPTPKPVTRTDPIDFYSNSDFRKRYRFSKETFGFIWREFEDDFDRCPKRHDALSAPIQLAIALRFYATGSFLEMIGDTLHSVSKSTVSNLVRDVSLVVSRKLDKSVCFPNEEVELRSITKGFSDIASFPGVVGAVDGTQIRIISPSGDQEPHYINQKGYHSINVQGICDHTGRFLNIVADWPGSVHDSRILQNSRIGTEFCNGQQQGILLGDNSYACHSWLLIPFLNPIGQAQKRFNFSQKTTRSTIERAFGVWKRRFHILHSEIQMHPHRICRVIGACAVLHNIAKMQNENDDFSDEDNEDGDNHDENLSVLRMRHIGENGQTFRAHFAQQHFS